MTLDPGRVQAIFLAAIESETLADRAAILNRERAADEELRRRVEVLLVAHDRSDILFDRPSIAPGERGASIREPQADRAGEVEPPQSRLGPIP